MTLFTPPGIDSILPARIREIFLTSFTAARAWTVVLNRRAINPNESPRLTRYQRIRF